MSLGGLPMFRQLAESDDMKNQLDGARGSALLVSRDENKHMFVKEGGVEILSILLQSQNPSVRSSACKGFAELTAIDECHQSLLDQEVVDTLLQVLNGNKSELASRHSAHALAN